MVSLVKALRKTFADYTANVGGASCSNPSQQDRVTIEKAFDELMKLVGSGGAALCAGGLFQVIENPETAGIPQLPGLFVPGK